MYKELYEDAREAVFKLSMLTLSDVDKAQEAAVKYVNAIYKEMAAKLKDAESMLEEADDILCDEQKKKEQRVLMCDDEMKEKYTIDSIFQWICTGNDEDLVEQ